jgi:hypothetical protein
MLFWINIFTTDKGSLQFSSVLTGRINLLKILLILFFVFPQFFIKIIESMKHEDFIFFEYFKEVPYYKELQLIQLVSISAYAAATILLFYAFLRA